MKKVLIKILVSLVLILVGWKVAEHGDSIVSAEDMQKSKALCEQSGTTMAGLQDTYEESTVKIKKIEIKMYTFTYNFEVAGKIFSTTSTSNKATALDSLKVWFDKNDPTVNSLNNPCVEHSIFSKEKTVGNRFIYYIGGILAILIGLGLLWNTVIQSLRKLFSSKKV